jgi:hypothetical protein
MEIGDIELLPLSPGNTFTPEQAGGTTDPKFEDGEVVSGNRNIDFETEEDDFLIPIKDNVDYSNTDFNQNTNTPAAVNPKEGDKPELSEVIKVLKSVLDEETGLMADVGEDEITDPKAFTQKLIEKLETKAENMVDDYIKNNLSQTQQLFNELVEGGVSVENAASISKLHKEINGLNSDAILTAEDDSVAERVAKTYYRLKTNMSDEEIDSEIKLKVQSGTIRDFASKNLSKVSQDLNTIIDNEKTKADKAILDNQTKMRQANESLQNFMKAKEIGEVKITKEVRDRWTKEFQKDNEGVTPLDRTVKTNPVKFNALLRLYHSMGLFNIDNTTGEFTPDFALIKSLAGKDTNKQFEAAVNKANMREASRTTSNTDTSIDTDHFNKLKSLGDLL